MESARQSAPRPKLTRAQRQVLLALIAKYPDAKDGRICRLFFARTDRELSSRSVRAARRRDPAPRDRAADRGSCGHLDSASRETLLALIAGHEGASDGEIRRLFSSATGRDITTQSVRRARDSGYVPGRNRGVQLARTDRELLLAMIRDAAASDGRSALARRFADRTGRAVTASMVSRLALHVLGLPPQRARNGARVGLL